jgi:putative transposase
VEQIVSVLKQSEVGVPVAELIRKVGISEQTFIVGRRSMLA